MSIRARLRLYYLVSYGAFGIYLPFFPSWLVARGFRGVELSLLSFVVPLLALVSPLSIGLLADQLGLRGSLLFLMTSTASLSLGFLGFLAHTSELTVFSGFLALLPFAFARGPMVSLAEVLALEHSADYGRTRLFGSLGFLLAAIVGGLYLNAESNALVPWLATAFLAGGALVSLSLPRSSSLPPRPALSDARLLLARPSFRMLLMSFVFLLGANTSYDLCATLRLKDLGAKGPEIGFFWAIGTSAEILLFLFAGRLVTRWGAERLLLLSAGTATARWLLLATVASRPVLLLLQPLHAVSFGLLWLTGVHLLRRHAEGVGLATAQGLFAAAVAIGGVLGLFAWGPLYERGGGALVFSTAAVVSLLGSLTATRLLPKPTVEMLPEERIVFAQDEAA